jgi:hypothetical protein
MLHLVHSKDYYASDLASGIFTPPVLAAARVHRNFPQAKGNA